MLSYDKWKRLNESLGNPHVLGFGKKQSLGIRGSTFHEEGCGCKECGYKMEDDDMEDDNEMPEEPGAEIDIEDYEDEAGDDLETVDVKNHDHGDDMGDEDSEDDSDFEDDGMEDDSEEDDMEDDSEEDDMEDDGMEDDGMGDDASEDDGSEDESEDDMDDDELDAEVQKMGESKAKSHLPNEEEWWKSVNSMIGNMTPSGDLIKESDAPLEIDVKGVSGPLANMLRRMNTMLDEDDFKKIASKTRELDLLEQILRPFIKTMVEKFNMDGAVVGNYLRRIATYISKEIETGNAAKQAATEPGAW